MKIIKENKVENFEELIEILKSNYVSKNARNFIFYNIIEFTNTSNQHLAYEIFYRYYPDQDNETVSNFEFIFNDVTMTKLTESKNIEIKYKTLFLSKIAHEFKNPLICINELIDQMCENIEEDHSKKYSLIKSLSDYLLILIKDLDYFSLRDKPNNVKITKNLIILEKLLTFCENVSKAILKKYNKDKNIKLMIIKDKNLPKEIYTDEIKLKQILINLISNSIKFTTKGKISLTARLSKDNENIEFTVEDTGIGISDDQKQFIFNPFNMKSEKKDNSLGAGLGLSIVYELSSKLGKRIQYESKPQKGTKFWFSIPNKNDTLHMSVCQHNHEVSSVVNRESFGSYKTYQHNYNKEINSFNEDSFRETKLFTNFEYNYRTRYSNINSISSKKDFESCESIIQKRQHNNNINIDIMTNSTSKDYAYKVTNNPSSKEYNIIVADDDDLIRQANIRILKKIAEKNNLNLNIIESADGIETIFIIFDYTRAGFSINCIISDQNMNYIGGTKTAKLIKDIFADKTFHQIPFFLLTAYENFQTENILIDNIYCKPLTLSHAEKIVKFMLNSESR